MYAFSFVRDLNVGDNEIYPTQHVVEPSTDMPSTVIDTLSVKDTAILKSTN
jgi:hypothetical protein